MCPHCEYGLSVTSGGRGLIRGQPHPNNTLGEVINAAEPTIDASLACIGQGRWMAPAAIMLTIIMLPPTATVFKRTTTTQVGNDPGDKNYGQTRKGLIL